MPEHNRIDKSDFIRNEAIIKALYFVNNRFKTPSIPNKRNYKKGQTAVAIIILIISYIFSIKTLIN